MMLPNESHTAQPQPWREFYSQWRFTVLLGVVVAVLAGPPLTSGWNVTRGWFDALMLLLLLAAILSLCVDRHERLFALALGVPTVLFSAAGYVLSISLGFWSLLVGHLCGTLFLLGAAGLVVRRLFRAPAITMDSIAGALCGYLFLGLGWAVTYSMIESFQPNCFEVNSSLRISGADSPLQPYVLAYYSFVTLTTVGYGEIVPVTSTAQTLAWMEAISGQFYLAVIVASLVSMLANKVPPAAERGVNNTRDQPG